MNSSRPLSPHLGVYKFMYTMSLSIMHRITGVAAAVGFIALVWWLMALATGPDACARDVVPVDAACQTTSRRVHVLLRLPLLQRHPAPRVGHRPRPRTRPGASQ